MLVLGLVLATTITITNSSNVETHSSASATGGQAVVEVHTNVNGEETHERRESTGGTAELNVHVTAGNSGSTTTVESNIGTTTAGGSNISVGSAIGTTSRAVVESVLSLIKKLLALFGLSTSDLQ
jgi:hypothetical protein